MSEHILYGYWRSSSTYRVRIALHHKGLSFETVPVNLLAGDQATPEHVARSPMGFVPCLLVDGEPFVESVAIVELLDELYPANPLFPRAPRDRARVRALVEMVAAGIQPLQNLSVLARVSGDPAGRREWSAHFITRGLAAIERLMDAHASSGVRGPFAYGGVLTAADAFLVPQVYNARRFGVDLAAFPRVAAAAAHAEAQEAVRAAHPDRQPDARPDP